MFSDSSQKKRSRDFRCNYVQCLCSSSVMVTGCQDLGLQLLDVKGA